MSLPDDHHRITGTAARRVLVAGATGRFGGIADLLLARGHTVRAATRDPARPGAARLAAAGAEIVRADFEDTGSLAAAAAGVDAVFASGSTHRAGPRGEERHGRNPGGCAFHGPRAPPGLRLRRGRGQAHRSCRP